MPVRLPAALVAAVLAALLLLLPSPPASAQQASLLQLTSTVTYDVKTTDDGAVHVTWDATLADNDPATDLSGNGTVSYYYQFELPVLRGADSLAATDSAGNGLQVKADDPGGNSIDEGAVVQFARRLFYGQTYTFRLTYQLSDSRSEGGTGHAVLRVRSRDRRRRPGDRRRQHAGSRTVDDGHRSAGLPADREHVRLRRFGEDVPGRACRGQPAGSDRVHEVRRTAEGQDRERYAHLLPGRRRDRATRAAADHGRAPGDRAGLRLRLRWPVRCQHHAGGAASPRLAMKDSPRALLTSPATSSSRLSPAITRSFTSSRTCGPASTPGAG